MSVTHKEFRRIFVYTALVGLLLLSYFVLRPIALSIMGGLLLAYVFIPLYRRVFHIFHERNTSALTVCVILVLVIFIPVWFLVPVMIQQVFDMFTFIQTLDIRGFVAATFTNAPAQFQEEIGSVAITFIGKVTTGVLGSLTDLLVELPTVLLHFAVVVFVFFFALRDNDKLAAYVGGLSPLKPDQQKFLNKQFKNITYSIMFGYVITGIVQGIATGVGLFLFGVPRALLLTVFAILASIFPLVGPWLIWIPAALYLFSIGNVPMAIGFILYSVLFVSVIDNIMRPYLVARKNQISSAVVLVGMIGGLLVFGVLGIILGPLILAYLLIFLTAYRNKTLSSMFTE